MITVTREGNTWIARFPFDYATKDRVKEAGFRFDGQRKVWWTSDALVAAKLAPEAVNQAVAASRAATSDFRIPLSAAVAARGWDFFPYQKAGVEFLATRKDALIGDEMGLGKTMQLIGLINADASIKRALIICPASLKLNWARELRLWLSREMTVEIANGGPWTGDCAEVTAMLRRA